MSSVCIPIPWQAAGGRTACRQAWQIPIRMGQVEERQRRTEKLRHLPD